MRRALLAFFVLILVGILLSLVFKDNQGYLLLSFGGWRVETSLLFACIALVIAIWVLAILWRILVSLVFAPGNIRGFLGRRRERKARHLLERGLGYWAEARWDKAEAELQKLGKGGHAPGVVHLFSAWAAQRRSHIAERDRYLDMAAADSSVSSLALLATRAELQIAAGQAADAGDTLARLHRLEPHHSWGLRMYGELLMSTGEYDRLYALLPDLQQHSHLAPERLEAMSKVAYSHRLAGCTELGVLTGTWKKFPKQVKARPELVYQYALCLKRLNAEDEAANVIRDALKTRWNEPLALLFSNLRCSDQTGQLATVEGWINEYGKKPALMMVAGRLCLRSRLWGRARSYFEASQAAEPSADGLLELAQVYERVSEFDQARKAYRKGLELRASE